MWLLNVVEVDYDLAALIIVHCVLLYYNTILAGGRVGGHCRRERSVQRLLGVWKLIILKKIRVPHALRLGIGVLTCRYLHYFVLGIHSILLLPLLVLLLLLSFSQLYLLVLYYLLIFLNFRLVIRIVTTFVVEERGCSPSHELLAKTFSEKLSQSLVRHFILIKSIDCNGAKVLTRTLNSSLKKRTDAAWKGVVFISWLLKFKLKYYLSLNLIFVIEVKDWTHATARSAVGSRWLLAKSKIWVIIVLDGCRALDNILWSLFRCSQLTKLGKVFI